MTGHTIDQKSNRTPKTSRDSKQQKQHSQIVLHRWCYRWPNSCPTDFELICSVACSASTKLPLACPIGSEMHVSANSAEVHNPGMCVRGECYSVGVCLICLNMACESPCEYAWNLQTDSPQTRWCKLRLYQIRTTINRKSKHRHTISPASLRLKESSTPNLHKTRLYYQLWQIAMDT